MSTKNRVFNKLAQVEEVELSAQKIELASTDNVYKLIFNGIKTADNSGLSNAGNSLQKAMSSFNKAESEANSVIKEINKIDPALLDGKVGSFLKTAIDIASKNSSKLKEAQGLVNKANSIIKSLQSKSKV